MPTRARVIAPHNVCLTGTARDGSPVRLRPMTEDDWPLLERWNSDPEVLFFSEGDRVSAWSPEEVRSIYRTVARHAFCFIIEHAGVPVGEGWLQEMNLSRVLALYPGKDVRRIDLMIGEKDRWGLGIGTETIRLITRFGLEAQGADVLYIPDVADYNERSLRAFGRAGYRVAGSSECAPGKKAKRTYDLAMEKLSRP